LLARQALWEVLTAYIEALDEEQFKRASVFLRRAFGAFGGGEKREICENLAHCWGLDEEKAYDKVAKTLTEEEESRTSMNLTSATCDGEARMSAERIQRWRLILGKSAEAALGPGPFGAETPAPAGI
jgi:hypothetical protein